MSKRSGSPLDHGSSSQEWRTAHDALKRDKELWRCLQFRGIQPGRRGTLFEIRHCPCCSSAVLRRISRKEALAVVAEESALLTRTINCLAPGVSQ